MNTTAHNDSKTFRLGGEIEVNRIGFGVMRLTGQPGNFGPYPDWEGGKALLRRAVELGVDFVDTAHAYGPEFNERLVAEALGHAPAVVIATKGGVEKRGPSDVRTDGSPLALRRQVETSLRNLATDRIDLYQLHRVDPNTPLEESVAALARMREEGKIRLIGLSNVDQAQLGLALRVTPIASVQNRFNVLEREHDALIDFTAERGIAFIPYGPLGAHPMQAGAPIRQLDESMKGRRGSPAQRALRWLLDRSSNVIVIPGTTTVRHLEENLKAWSLAPETI